MLMRATTVVQFLHGFLKTFIVCFIACFIVVVIAPLVSLGAIDECVRRTDGRM